MKKLYLLGIFSLLTMKVFSQNAYTLNTRLVATQDMVTPTNTIVNGDTVEFFNSDEYSAIVSPLIVINNNGSTHNVKVRRTQLSMVPGAISFFCWDLCYAPATSLSGGTVAVPANDSVFVFYADYNALGNSGTSYVQYKFFNDLDSTEFASVVVKYTSGTVGIEEQASVISNVYPNPASSLINFEYVLEHGNGSIVITDLTGKVVRTATLPVNSTRHTFGLEGLNDGIYIYTFYEGNKTISTKKFIINK